jgi:hypothetical protein
MESESEIIERAKDVWFIVQVQIDLVKSSYEKQ